MSLITPAEWFEQIVEPNYRCFEAQPDNERHAFNAILAVHHFWDRVYQYWERTDRSKLLGASTHSDFLVLLIKQHGDEIEILNDVANALKHHFLTRRSLGRDPSQLWATTATGSFYRPTPSSHIATELEIANTGRTVKDVLAKGIAYCLVWC
jgi:hypothetical protein